MTSDVAPPTHAPEMGPMRRWLGGLHFTGVFWYRLHRFGVRVLPEWSLTLVVTLFTTFFFCALGGIRRAIADNLDVVLGPCSWWRRQQRVYRTLWNFAWCLSERYERLEAGTESLESAEGEEYWRRSLAGDQGLILVTAHIGHWEVGAMQVHKRHVHVVREDEIDPKAAAFVRELFNQEQSAAQSEEIADKAGFTMHFVRDDPAMGLRLMHALRNGDLVAVQGDRPRSSGRSCRVKIFDRPLDLAAGPAALARAAGVVLLPVFVFRLGRHQSRVVFRPPVEVTGAGAEGLTTAMQEVAGHVEWAIRRDPLQWFCFRRLWS